MRPMANSQSSCARKAGVGLAKADATADGRDVAAGIPYANVVAVPARSRRVAARWAWTLGGWAKVVAISIAALGGICLGFAKVPLSRSVQPSLLRMVRG
jgi:hypothetical protein